MFHLNSCLPRFAIPHQLGNILDLVTPLHIRVKTDGLFHPPVVRFPIVDLFFRGYLNKATLVPLIHGGGIHQFEPYIN
ncbi:hypothetical protein B4U80_06875 [Leptotrombidium deliense]|uniref:Uncharacterized protein n=1 Tax=Leptotrombidium deliense TaxID=299467 RepID=A0A443SV62_9ACAR|nr:hypothetical protein B4U80_06875 [Leptotrombidium deliense]